jgi:phosphoribosylanthranilate isomerase
MTETPPKVKICGITDLRDAELAVELGAWAIGMVFYEHSPRQCSTEQALRITTALRRRTELCGVFVDATLDEIAQRAEELSLTMLQLHGDEGPSFCAEAARRTGAHVIKAAQVSGAGDVRDLERFHVDFHLLDARARAPHGQRQELRGGTGETFDWSLLSARHSKTPLILSGGLHQDNVAEAIERVRPYAVDTASGTERAPGHKDETKLRAFFDAVAATATRAGSPTIPADVTSAAETAIDTDKALSADGVAETAATSSSTATTDSAPIESARA